EILDLVGVDEGEVAAKTSNHAVLADLAVLGRRISGSELHLRFLIGPQPGNFVGQLALVDLAVRRDEEAVFIDAGIDRQAGNQTDVGAFRRLNGADAAVVRDVHITHFEAGAFAVKATGAQSAQTSLVRKLGQRIGLIDDLAQFAATEKVLD